MKPHMNVLVRWIGLGFFSILSAFQLAGLLHLITNTHGAFPIPTWQVSSVGLVVALRALIGVFLFASSRGTVFVCALALVGRVSVSYWLPIWLNQVPEETQSVDGIIASMDFPTKIDLLAMFVVFFYSLAYFQQTRHGS